MKLPFLDRDEELTRLSGALANPDALLIVLYGRRRCGKSTLIQRVAGPKDVYFLADQREAALQIRSLAREIARVLPRFDKAEYPTWDALLGSLHERAGTPLNLLLDEFPYLVHSAPELPSLIQRYLDGRGDKRIRFILCGSSQRMMQGVVLHRSAPLYGRAHEILKIRPLGAGWIEQALSLSPADAVEAYSVWGGVPRYWELGAGRGTMEAVRSLVLDRHGVLHEEPFRLLLDDMRSAVQPNSILSLIGGGCHRMSELAGRMRKPAGSMSRPIAGLIDLGYIRRETPWGESPRSTKRTLYHIADPFLAFYFRFVEPNRSLLEAGLWGPVLDFLAAGFPAHVAGVWENLARDSVPFSNIEGIAWRSASRWWGAGTDRRPLEIDVVAESIDRKTLLLGEARWSGRSEDARAGRELEERAGRCPFVQGRKVVLARWLKQRSGRKMSGHILTSADVMALLRTG